MIFIRVYIREGCVVINLLVKVCFGVFDFIFFYKSKCFFKVIYIVMEVV